MNEDILRKLEQRVNRRSFLRGSTLIAASVVGAARLPQLAWGQEPQQQEPTKDEPAADQGEKKDAPKDETKKDGDQAEVDPFKETKVDDQGRQYRLCPQCGYNMYKQDRTWTCENCGYSYIE